MKQSRTPLKFVFVSGLIGLCLVGCQPKSEPPKIKIEQLNIQGSNTIGEKLIPAMAQAYLEQTPLSDIERHAESSVATKFISKRKRDHRETHFNIEAHGSSTAFTALQEKRASIGMSSRPIKAQELEALTAQAAGQDLIREHVIAFDALAIVVHPQNPIAKLTIEELAQIFSGEIDTWHTLNGVSEPIHLHARDDNSGTYDTFQSLVLKPNDKALSAKALRYESSEQLVKNVMGDPNAIGFIGFAHRSSSKLLAIKSTSQSHYTLPNPHTIGTEQYALSRRLFLYERAEPQSELHASFLSFVLSNEGQKLVRSTGLIPFYPTRDKPKITDVSFSNRYKSLASLADRLSVQLPLNDLGFEKNAEAQRDIQRLQQFASDRKTLRFVLAIQGEKNERDKINVENLEAILSNGGIPIIETVYTNTTTSSGNSTFAEVWVM